MNSSKPLTVTLGEQQHSLDARLQSGEYESASEIVQAGLRALDREDAAKNDEMREKIQEALDCDGPDFSADDVFDEIERTHTERFGTKGRGL